MRDRGQAGAVPPAPGIFAPSQELAVQLARAASVLVVLGLCAQPAVAQKKLKIQREPIVAVLPFKVLNPEPKLQHFGEGASEALINAIIKDKSLKLVEESQLDKALHSLSRNQTGLFEEDSALAVGQMVDARFIVIGSVDVLADQIAISARVLEVETRQLLVSDRLHGPFANAFSLYDELAGRLIRSISDHLQKRVVTGAGDNSDAVAVMDLLKSGKASDPLFGGANLPVAIDFYKKAVLRDPNSATARLALGQAMNQAGAFQEAKYNLKQSTELDKNNPMAWTEYGVAIGKLGDRLGARQAFERAVLLDPKNVKAQYCLAVELYNAGMLDGARQHAAVAMTLGDQRAAALLRDVDQRIASSKVKQPAPK